VLVINVIEERHLVGVHALLDSEFRLRIGARKISIVLLMRSKT
jgi:hypothetical protein